MKYFMLFSLNIREMKKLNAGKLWEISQGNAVFATAGWFSILYLPAKNTLLIGLI